jgi:hypothetical protein
MQQVAIATEVHVWCFPKRLYFSPIDWKQPNFQLTAMASETLGGTGLPGKDLLLPEESFGGGRPDRWWWWARQLAVGERGWARDGAGELDTDELARQGEQQRTLLDSQRTGSGSSFVQEREREILVGGWRKVMEHRMKIGRLLLIDWKKLDFQAIEY